MKPYFRIEWFGETSDFEGWNDSGVNGEKYTLESALYAYHRECINNPHLTHRLVMVLDKTSKGDAPLLAALPWQ